MSDLPSVTEINGYVIYRGVDNAAWFILDTTPAVGGGNVVPTSWSDPVSLGGYIISNPTMARRLSTNDDLEVFAAGGDHALWVTVSNGSTYGPWQSLGGDVVGDPFAVRNGDRTIDVFAIGSDGTLSHIRQSAASIWQ
jgi:hypothetical protein